MAVLWRVCGLMARLTRTRSMVALVAVASSGIASCSEGPDERTITLGRSLYQAHCVRCHGKNLEGQPDWQTRLPSGRLPAPPHDASGHTWHHADSVLIGVTKHGLKPYAGEDYESDMPAFVNVLSDREIEAIIAYIKSTWPEREREYQERMTARSMGESE
jgi:mono/diheme cytochrome c family protein